MSSFEGQSNHEVRSLRLSELVKNKNDLAHLGSISIVMTNYEISNSWWSGPEIVSRRDTMELGGFEKLEVHLRLKPSSVKTCDSLAVNSVDAAAINRALKSL
jgi:hypothetical protein